MKTTGGKGLHVVVPLRPASTWEESFAFSRAISEEMERASPRAYTTAMPKAQRRGRILIDYLRNNRGNTSVAAYSTRARSGAPVSTPITWAGAGVRRPPGPVPRGQHPRAARIAEGGSLEALPVRAPADHREGAAGTRSLARNDRCGGESRGRGNRAVICASDGQVRGRAVSARRHFRGAVPRHPAHRTRGHGRAHSGRPPVRAEPRGPRPHSQTSGLGGRRRALLGRLGEHGGGVAHAGRTGPPPTTSPSSSIWIEAPGPWSRRRSGVERLLLT